MKIQYLFILIPLFFAACSTSPETQKENGKGEPEFYLFDDVEHIDSVEAALPGEPEDIKDTVKQRTEEIKQQDLDTADKKYDKYIIQLGAFSSKERAESFIRENQDKISYLMTIVRKQQNNLYYVQIPPFQNRADAESVRNTLWKIIAFKDAFIVTE
jgi:cell division septation protein DedD